MSRPGRDATCSRFVTSKNTLVGFSRYTTITKNPNTYLERQGLNSAKRYLVLALLLALTVLCYAMGMFKGAVVAAMLGVLFEMAFWVSLIRGRRNGATR